MLNWSFVNGRSGRGIEQFCFGSTYLQLNPNYRRLERADPLTWKKEGISAVWSGARGLRKSCCKVSRVTCHVLCVTCQVSCVMCHAVLVQVCCQERLCGGCGRAECECRGGVVRGGYDGLVVLACVTRDTAPRPGRLDHEEVALVLECSLTTHFMQCGDPGLARTIVHSGRDSFLQVRPLLS